MKRCPIVCGVLALTLLGCGATDTPVTIGIALPTGWYRAVSLGLEEVADVRLELLRDSSVAVGQSLPGMRYAQWLADRGVAAVIGHDASRPSVEAASVYNAQGVLQVAPMVTSRALEQQGPWSFSLAPSDSVEASFIAAYIDTLFPNKRVALLYHNDEFGIGLRDALTASLQARNIPVVDERFFPPTTMPSREPDQISVMVRAALLAEPDVFVLGIREVDTKIVADLLDRLAPGIPIVCSDASWVTAPAPGDDRFGALAGLHVVRFWGGDWSPRATEFSLRFTARFGQPPDHAEALSYEAFMLIADAVRSGARTGHAIRQYLERLDTIDRHPQRERLVVGFRNARPWPPRLDIGVVHHGRLLARDSASAGVDP